jgi:hypothetical protein
MPWLIRRRLSPPASACQASAKTSTSGIAPVTPGSFVDRSCNIRAANRSASSVTGLATTALNGGVINATATTVLPSRTVQR